MNDPQSPAYIPETGALASEKASKGKVVSWAFWDWATQPFATVITTFVFAVYLVSDAFVPEGGDPNEPAIKLAWATAIAGLFIALLAPVLGQGSDRHGKRMFNLRWQTWLLAAICAAMYFVKPAPEFFLLGAVLLGLGNVVAEIANVNYYAAIDQVSTPRNVGRVSGFGWGMGYLGGIMILLVIIGAFGSDLGSDGVRMGMIICGAWTLIFSIPIFRAIKDRKPEHAPQSLGIIGSYKALFASIRGLWHNARNTLFFLIASALFRDGLAGVFAFGGVLAGTVFGFEFGEVIIFGVVANVVAGVATMLFGLLDDRVGPKQVILFSLACLIALGLAIFFVARHLIENNLMDEHGVMTFWILGLLMCIFVGPAQSASRSFLARLIPEGMSGEIFGLYATTGRTVSFLSPFMFGVFVTMGVAVTSAAEDSAAAQYWGILGIVLVLVVGFVLALLVKSPPRDNRVLDHSH
ncbi:MAG: MFS transporter [Actinomycetia bacterium]|nr:MFS transporter [Actinomycetes bacterium]